MKEKPFLISGSSEKPADVFIPNFSSGKGLVIDTAISCPMQQKYVHNSSLIQGFTCNEYVQSIKVKNFGIKVTSEGFEYLLLMGFLLWSTALHARVAFVST